MQHAEIIDCMTTIRTTTECCNNLASIIITYSMCTFLPHEYTTA